MDAQLIPNIPEILDERAAKRIKSWPHVSNRASEAGHPCARFLVLARTDNDKRELHDIRLQRIFDLGNILEDAALREISEAGVRVVEQQRAFEWPKFQLTGRVDGLLSVNGTAPIPLEIKSSSPNVLRAVADMAPSDMITSKYSWIRKYPAQLLMYMLFQNVEMGVMLFLNKLTWEKCWKLFILDGPMLDYAESILKKLEAVNAHIAAGTKPEAKFIDDCKGCPFAKTACFVGMDYGPGIDITTDPETEGKLARREELKPAADEFEDLDKEIKDAFKGRTAVVGAWMIESKPYEATSFDIPKEIKAQYAVKKQAFRTSIEKI
jgi:hypothetical protein